MSIIHTNRRPPKSKKQKDAEWLAKLHIRLAKRKAKEAARIRPKKQVEFTHADLSPALLDKLGLTDLNNTIPVPPSQQEQPKD